MNKITEIIRKCGAAKSGAINYSECDIINPRLIEKLPFSPETVFIGIVPYYTHYCDQPRNVSAYALAYDYHLYIKELCERIITEAQAEYPHAEFSWFCDHSPINEKTAAAKAGLGIIGEHSLLITPEYSSFVFLFEIFTDLKYSVKPNKILNCEKCGKCIESCPADLFDKRSCLSAVTQKKGTLSENEKQLIQKTESVWGCDICQTVCPHTINALKTESIYSETAWFNYNIISSPTQESVSDLTDFSKRAYSWRGPQTILRNIDIFNNKEKNNET